ncbi:VOC family protein [Nitrogeniibacter mangrovi]|uniref:VOC family protein n=1 Tax=Nitrogeniibacter mangrovi TaxID=2016596 RepID=A0A6C1B1Y6_9RHOO|nr:VOC family protein [Nitrogeniibacter mangrovi]QID17577.1 VOC family protein [Nitrogeniibacter mangrovi]
MPTIHQKIKTFLWFNDQAEEAARFYTSVFDTGRIVRIARYNGATPDKEGAVMLVTFELAGQTFIALNGGFDIPFDDAVSLLVECDSQAEIDTLWSRLTDGGEERPCGWLRDRFGLSWQIAPTRLLELVTNDDPETAATAMRAMFDMKKIVIADIERAVNAQ